MPCARPKCLSVRRPPQQHGRRRGRGRRSAQEAEVADQGEGAEETKAKVEPAPKEPKKKLKRIAGDPDVSIMRQSEAPSPAFPVEIFGIVWAKKINGYGAECRRPRRLRCCRPPNCSRDWSAIRDGFRRTANGSSRLFSGLFRLAPRPPTSHPLSASW